ncbi:probable G-protein coupled receptor B0563.6 [Physella acuta]|uniref:probable G-protein coupled receptor B0563.6 n=1 Tax=Physella acuta TaxID=109671 RepID=UPI0027DB114A|nr:probable G-protein coupled receptor B0563.6 [Physella acuta]
MSSNNFSVTFSKTPAVSSDVIGNDVYTALDIFLNCFAINFLSLIGLVGNLINILVLSRHDQSQTTTILLTSLSVIDLLCSFFQPFRRLQCLVAQFDPPLAASYRTFVTAYVYNLVDILMAMGICHVTAIAVERFTAVLFPLHVSRVFTPWRVKTLILGIYITTLGLLAPMFFRLTHDWGYDPKLNTTVAKVVFSKFYVENFDSFNFYTRTFINNLFSTIPLLIIFICSSAITIKLSTGDSKKIIKNSNVDKSSKKIKEAKVAKMLLAVCLVTFVAYLPSAVIYTFMQYANIPVLLSGNVFYILQSAICVLYQLNASSNFFIYVTMSSKFASTYRSLFKE